MAERTDEILAEGIQKRIQYQLDHTWLNLIDVTKKDQFLNNFSDEDKIAGLILLDMLLFHNQVQEKQLTKTLIRQLRSQIYKNLDPCQDENSETIFLTINEEMKHMAFIPVIDKNPADSANAWSGIMREMTGTSDCFFDIEKLPLLLTIHKKYIVFYDDMIGTGTQFDDFLRKERFELNDKKKLSIKKLMDESTETLFYYLCLAGHTDGIAKIEKTYPKIRVLVSEKFDNDDSILSKNNENWEYYTDDQRDRIIQILERVMSDRKINIKFTKNLPVIFERNRPSNTVFPLYWYNEDHWLPIKAREGM
jgi:hypothetical protein